jgi:vitamin B12 transporter
MRQVLSVFAFLTLSLFGGLASAEEPPPSTLTETVSVTASRTPIPLAETGNSITILTREEIERRGSVFLADLLRGIPGLSVSRSGPAGSLTQIRARGAEANHLLVQVDGVDVSDAFAGDALPYEMMTSEDIESIEFVRGPQSGLWGSDAVAGVLNIITRDSDRRGGSILLEGGSFGSRRVAGKIGLGSETVRMTANLSRFDSDGTNISRQGGERDGSENNSANARLTWAPEERGYEFDLSVRHTESESEFDDVDYVTTGLPTDADNVTDTDLTLAQLTINWDRGDARRWNHRMALSSTSSDTETFRSSSFDGSTAIDKIAASLQTTAVWGDSGGPQHRLSLALDHESRDFEQRGTASIFGDPNQNQELDNTGMAVEYRFRADNRWAATATVRQEQNSDFDDISTFRATGSYSLRDERTRLRAAIGTGQKAPTFLERFGFFSNTFIGNPDLLPEQSTSWECGIDRQIGVTGNLALTYFNAQLEDEINGSFFDSGAGAFTAVNVNGDSDRSGVEASFDAPLRYGLDILVSYTYTDSDEPNGLGGEQRELRRPRNMARANLGWRSSEGNWNLWLGADFNGVQQDIFFPPFPAPSQRVEIDDYLVTDFTASWRIAPSFTLTARIDNLLDEEYENVFGFSNSGVAGFIGLRYAAAGGR